ncbi:ChrR family anti-sigma-E factor [Psychrobium sp. nBUS_13]|jgi:putative transcriptional regulator|uniref:ChrR family anti-sigma-E factor n=1 Tax=Psychrobium sp. nBUS_13 TaxID=3395319 RepID=UPI003EB8E40C
MITHHPSDELLTAFTQGELTASLSIAVAAHNELCPVCQEKVEKLNAQQAQMLFDSVNETVDEAGNDLHKAELNWVSMIDEITDDDSQSMLVSIETKSVKLSYDNVQLPRALSNVSLKKWSKLGDVSRARLELQEEPIRSSLLDISPGGVVPLHTHKGFELTLLLDGSFEDDMGSYHAGDFIWLDKSHSHSPRTTDGCLCYAVLDDAMEFKEGFSKLFNPIGSYLY